MEYADFLFICHDMSFFLLSVPADLEKRAVFSPLICLYQMCRNDKYVKKHMQCEKNMEKCYSIHIKGLKKV